MIFVPSNNLKPGMTLTRDIWGKNSLIPLVRAGNILSQKIINSFVDREIIGAYVEFEGTEDIEVNEVFPMEKKVRVTADIKRTFQSLQNDKNHSFQNMNSLNHVADYILDVFSDNNEYMMNMIEIKNYNEYAYVHSIQVTIICVLIGKKLKFSKSRLKDITIAGMLHDLGKTNLPLTILDKEGPLTEDEFTLIKEHPSLAVSKLAAYKTLSKEILDGIGQHHEKGDGTGYPNNLLSNEISEFGKIIAIADVYDALITDRPYRPAWDTRTAIDYMMSRAEFHFDVYYLNVFLSIVAAYPIGVLVKLNNGLSAVVVGSNEGLPLNPVIRILTRGENYGKVINLASDREALTIQIISIIKDEESMKSILNK